METWCLGSESTAGGWPPVSLCACSDLSHYVVELVSQENLSALWQLIIFQCVVTFKTMTTVKMIFIKVL